MAQRLLLALLVLGLLGSVCPAEEEGAPPDAFLDALRDAGLEESDLGYRPRGHWNRFPQPPHLLPFFRDLLARPLDTYEFARTLGNAVEDHLTPDALTRAPTVRDRGETAFRLGVLLGTERRIGGFRGYSANLDPLPAEEEPLLAACVTLLERSGRPLRRPMSFGGRYADEEPTPREALRARVGEIPEPLHRPLARFLLNLVQAREWIDLGLRRVPQALREEVFASIRNLAEDTPDGLGYDAVIDDVARLVDEHSLHYGCLKALQATQDARRELGRVPEPEEGWPDFRFHLDSGWGSVVIYTDAGGQDLRVEDPLLLVRLASGNPVDSPIGATGPRRPLSVALLLDSHGRFGVDVGAGEGKDVDDVAAVASGILGCGIVYAAGSEPGYYKTGFWGLGAGLFGLGALVDEGGDDQYRMRGAGQGAAFFGAGLLLDAAGDDRYELWEGDGQGFGGPGGIGVLADRSGDDAYYSEPDAAKAGRADYHSEDRVAVSNAQGVGSGRRGDGSDGHSWAGGLGALIDVDGDDRYRAGNFSQGLGYWFGTGILWDGGGDDEYRSVYFTQGSGAHFAIGALIDEGGNDVHVLEDNAGAAFGFGWDVVNAFLLDRGVGDDRYEAQRISTAMAMVRSNAFFLDEGGDDVYVLQEGQQGLGQVDERPTYAAPGRTATFPFHLDQVAVFLDLGGRDTYRRSPRADGEAPAPDPEAGDDRTWRLRARDPAARGGWNVAVGRDVPSGRAGFLDPWPARAPPPEPAPDEDEDEDEDEGEDE